ncbi:MAG: SDR family NAD(P)-dependent oxidoreductase [Alphaproteobacteria bacterium]|nr:SDR family NAD(P)-dependent oxidoreductase [Alphaproteobacteria bacterium]MBF0128389.1 SDR family NAD(P)-dependent oxidoreductase [Alphaproteobacteria bacterium]
MKAAVVGASAGLGRALAERLAEAGHELVLVARDSRDLEAVACDLRIRFATSVRWLEADLAVPDAAGLRARIKDKLGRVDALFLVAGLGDDTDHGPMEEAALERVIAVNYTSPVAIANAFLPDLMDGSLSHLVGIGSVAAMRARSRNMVYGSAKRGLEFYFEALRHRLSAYPCRIQLYRVGFMDTSMLPGRGGPLAASPDSIARAILARLGGPGGVAYLPRWWRLVAILLGVTPWRLFIRFKG